MSNFDSDSQFLTGYPPSVLPSWRPKPGEKVTGTLVRCYNTETKFGTAQVAVLKQPCGQQIRVWLTPTKLRLLFDRTKPTPGDEVTIRYLGTTETTSGYEIKEYTLDCQDDLISPMPLWPEIEYAADDPFVSEGQTSPLLAQADADENPGADDPDDPFADGTTCFPYSEETMGKEPNRRQHRS